MKHGVTRGRLRRTLTERTKALMSQRGWKVADVARRAGTCTANVYAVLFETHGLPNVATLAVVAKGLGCTVGHLLGEDETLSPAAVQTDEQMSEWLTAFREVDAETITKLQAGLDAAGRRMDALTVVGKRFQKERDEADLTCKAREGDISLMRGMVDELKVAKKTLLDKLENAARERRTAEQRYFVLAEACEKAFEAPTWVAAQRGYVVSQDNASAIRRALNKNPLSDIPPANNVKAELADGTVLAKPANGAS